MERTEEWLQRLNRGVASRVLTLAGNSPTLLAPWTPWLRAPMEIVGWLNPMEVQLTWQYLLHFLAASGPDSVVIPCGGDAVVSWQPGTITIRAPHNTWVWALATDSWDPAGWHFHDRVEWWKHGRLQQAARTHWGIFEQWQHPYGIEEWRLRADSGAEEQLTVWWEKLANLLGSRPVKVSWRQEHSRNPHNILGLPVRVAWLGLKIAVDSDSLQQGVAQWPEPLGLRASMHWSSPQWNPFWSTRVVLKRWRQTTRLEAHYTLLKSPLHKSAVKTMRQEMHRFPIFRVQPVEARSVEDNPSSWLTLVNRARFAFFKEHLMTSLRSYPWPAVREVRLPTRIRLPLEWRLDRLGSRDGVWAIRHQRLPLVVMVHWPRPHHAGGVTVTIGGEVHASLSDLDPYTRIDRFAQDWRYWAYMLSQHLLPAIDRHAPRDHSPD
ncbi:hypothetical protein BXT84_07180 [Sulfobacillus thermotolerans]|uniref:Uncharacterized protein n=1 Tax=Sulfobacillus thermotolerans TaxID=338644 RepID=A0ABN5GZF9_9FIRM|nr:hypothetical protein BXT84_07180 [Sulfobacillus thermotolerans]